jgi:hypothetical protein
MNRKRALLNGAPQILHVIGYDQKPAVTWFVLSDDDGSSGRHWNVNNQPHPESWVAGQREK